MDGWLRLAEAGFREAVEFSEYYCQKSIRSVRQRAEHLCAESGVNFSEQFNGIDVIVDVIAVEQFWLTEWLSTWMVRLLERGCLLNWLGGCEAFFFLDG